MWVAETESEGFYQSKSGSKGSEMELVLIISIIVVHQTSKMWKLSKTIKDLHHDLVWFYNSGIIQGILLWNCHF